MAELEYASEFPDFDEHGLKPGEWEWGANIPVPTRHKGWGLDDALTLVR